MSLTRLDFSAIPNFTSTLVSSSSASSPSPVDPSLIIARMDDNQNSVIGSTNGPFTLPAVTSAAGGAPSYHSQQQNKLSRNSNGAGGRGSGKGVGKTTKVEYKSLCVYDMM